MIKRVFRFLIVIGISVSLAITGFILSVSFGFYGHLYSRTELKEFNNQTATRIFSRDGQLIGQFFEENRTNVKYDEIPTYVIDALVATEDARYFSHEGVDSRSLLRVLFKSIILNDPQAGGGSTITQQLVKNMYGRKNFGPLTMLVNKTKEGLLARRLESIYSKEEILALYLNTVPFGENVFGIESASRLFFNKSIDQLRMDEGAVLVGMLKANTYYNPRLYPENALTRRNVVFAQMAKYSYLTESEKDSLQALPLVLDYANLESEGPANYFLVQVRKELEEILKGIGNGKEINYKTDGLRVTTTLDYQLQNFSLRAFSQHLSVMQEKLRNQYTFGSSSRNLEKLAKAELNKSKLTSGEKQNREVFSWDGGYTDSLSEKEYVKLMLTTLQAGMMGIHPVNGEILAWVGGIDFRTQPYDQILAKRQLASTFKPVLYASALEKGMAPCDYLSNNPKTFTDFENWKPSNYDHSDGGMYSFTGALKKSMNIPTVDLYMQVGFEEVDYLWRKLGFSFPLQNSPSLALGTGESSIYELAIAYSAFANGGYMVEPKTILSIEDAQGNTLYSISNRPLSNPVLENRTIQLMNAMLQEVINQGTGSSLRGKYDVRMPLAGKTGTSQNYVDAWFVGYNPSIVLVSRVGASNPAIHFNSGNGSGGKLALPLVGLTLQQLEQANIKSFSKRFTPLSDSLQILMDCPDYRDENAFEQLKELFESDKTTTEKQEKKSKPKEKKKKGILNFWKK